MQATRFWVAALVAGLVSASSPGCGEDVRTPLPLPPCYDCRGEGRGEGGGGDAGGVAGEPIGSSGSSPLPEGGAAGAPHVGGAAGADSHGEQGGMGGVSAGGEGGAANGKGEQLELCVRLAQPSPNADQVGRAYTAAVTLDCRVTWVMPLGQDAPTFQNQVLLFNYSFWGCPRRPPVEAFGLVFGTPALSQGDVNLLIEHYLTVAQNTLALSPLERETMQAALVRLSTPLIAQPSLEPSKSSCAVSVGGAGGAGGADAGGADAGGADAGGADTGGAGGALNGAGGAP